MARREDLEASIRQSIKLIGEYDDIARVSTEPKEREHTRQRIEKQWNLVRGYLSEYTRLPTDPETPMPPDITDVVALITIPASDVAPRLKALRAHHPLATIPLDTIPEPAALPPPPPPPPPLPLRILRTIGAIVLGALGGFIVGMVLPFIITPALITVGIGGSDLDASTRLFEQVFRITTWGMAACGTLIGALLGWGGRTATNTAWTALGGGIVAFVLAMLGMLGFLDPDQQQYGSRRRRK